MNKFYRYPNMELWNSGFWKSKLGAADPLFQWIQEHNTADDGGFISPDCEDPLALPEYRRKTKCVDLPSVKDYWTARGLSYNSLEQGQKLWISITPAERQDQSRLPMLVVPVHQDYSDPWWAMKTIAANEPILEVAAKSRDFVLVFLVTQGCDTDRIYCGILQEAMVLYRCDMARVYLDVRVALDQGVTLKSISGFRWVDQRGDPLDPDASVERFSVLEIPVLNIGGRWGNRDSLNRSLVMEHGMNNGTFDRDWYIHSSMGKHTMEGIVLEYQHEAADSDEIRATWKSLGLKVGDHETEGERWMVLCPRESQGKLPVMVIMQEVYRGNDHLAVTAQGTFYSFAQIAGQGECALLFFALEHPDANDLLTKILPEMARLYPVDLSRVYLTGHSHNGYFALHFAIRNPRLVAGVATMGNPMALEPPEERGEPVLAYNDQQVELLSQVDMPLINLCGYCERAGRVPQNSDDYTRWIRNIQRRLKASRCRVRSEEEIRNAKGCSDQAQRKLGIPADHSETVWHDGVEHYIVDINNIEGKHHLRLVSSENIPHMPTPYTQEMAWSFLRRFARDQKTGKILELY